MFADITRLKLRYYASREISADGGSAVVDDGAGNGDEKLRRCVGFCEIGIRAAPEC